MTMIAATRMNDMHQGDDSRTIVWHRELSPLDAELMSEHTVEATSGRVAGTLAHRDELWDRRYEEPCLWWRV